jgi:hypothetical protein
MNTINVKSEQDLDFSTANRVADAVAASLIGEQTVCLSWYDRVRQHECPAHASECHDDSCDLPGYIEYAESRGAQLRVDIDDGTYVFCYRSVEEFA